MNPNEAQRAARMHDVIGAAFRHLAREGFHPVEINGFCMGMCRKSLSELLGDNLAEKADREARQKIGWR
ncbi:MAG: hypothetical protein E6Q97_14830 [Desulfurellales bacterium]|nr:MAG: hypothetical protein E6Q97_14830 [Desulfurellales bacterium]